MLTPPARHSKSGDAARGYSGEKLMNYFAREGDGVSPMVLLGRSGFVARASVSGPVRAIHGMGGSIYAAAGGAIWRVLNGVATYVGSIPDDANTYMASSGTQLAVVAGSRYFVSQGTTATEHTTGAVETPHGVAFLDGYFVVTGESTGREDCHAVSSLNDATTFDASDFAFAESAADGIQAVIADHGELWFLGSETIETWYNSGGDYPFARNPGSRVEHGCANGKTVAKEDNAVFWLGDDGAVYRSGGGTPQVISTREVEEELNDVVGGFTFSDRGHRFYALTRRNASTYCYDLTTGLWAERSTGIPDSPWVCTCSFLMGGVEYFGTSDGKVGVLAPDAYSDDGEVIEAEVISTPIERNGAYFPISKIHANFSTGQSGIGYEYVDGPLATESAVEFVTETGAPLEITDRVPRKPKVMLQVSRDGQTWGKERWRDLPELGHYNQRVTWHGLGAGRRFQARIRITDPVSRDLYGVHVA